MDQVIRVAWGAEYQDYEMPGSKHWNVKGHQCMPGFRKRKHAQAAHLQYDLRSV